MIKSEAFEMRIWRRTKRIKQIDRVKPEEVLNRMKENETLRDNYEDKRDWVVHIINDFLISTTLLEVREGEGEDEGRD